MAAPNTVKTDTPITIKLLFGNEQKRTKLPLKDLSAGVLPAKLRALLAIPADQEVVFERWSDSAGAFVKLDDNNPAVYKQLFRAAKAKLKLRIRVNAVAAPMATPSPAAQADAASDPNMLAFDQLHIDAEARRHQEGQLREMLARQKEEQDRQTSVASQLRGLSSYVDSLSENMAMDYSAAFGGQLPSFLDAPAEPEMPRYRSPPFNAFSVCCNKCNYAIPDHHWHCGTCEEGDFDLCQQCLDAGNHCNVPDHFLVKRTLEDGKIISSTTEKAITPKPRAQPELVEARKETVSEVANEVPGAFSRISEEFISFATQPSRTCNSCISIYDDSQFVTCKDCEDFDLCISCHVQGQHGHHPAHTFTPAIPDMILEDAAAAACEPGRSQHHDAVCDGCDMRIVGVRHKCLDCPDFDYCSGCHKSAQFIHQGHRFAPVYGPLPPVFTGRVVTHHGIRCDGPMCSGRAWIVGDRYKCAICHDTDFCASCEALPTNPHNRTHPLIKFRTPVRNVNVTTHEEEEDGQTTRTHGDLSCQTDFAPAPSANASTQAEVPVQAAPAPEPEVLPAPVKIEQPIVEEKVATKAPESEAPEAYYVRDYVPDGTKILPGKPIFQTWVMYNPSGTPWPAGCHLRWAGGDSMLDVDSTVPGKVAVYESAATSNATASEISMGTEYSFSVKLRAPEKIGRATSYWRLYTPDGLPFGHRLWCEVEVVAELPKVEADEEKAAAKTEIKEEPVKQEQAKELTESQMVFPKLDKESPASSTHLSAPQSDAQTAVIAEEAEELISHDDLESITVDDDDTTDDGFFTDEDYDMVEDARS